jgi:UDP-N-acetylmuramoylalanine--D-glutamate ligase
MATTDPLQGKRLVILGMARQGVALARFAAQRGASVVISDLGSAESLAPALASLADCAVEVVTGSHPLTLLDGADALAPSGGVPLTIPIIREAQQRGIPLTNDSLVFMQRCPALVIGITGSAGKSTTTALTGAMGQASGRTTWVGGNIGRSLLIDLPAMQPGDLVVQELSSFQLDLWEGCSPQIAAILNITPNHLDRHRTMEAYTAAKANIVRHQRPGAVAVLPLGALDELAGQTAARVRRFSHTQPVDDGACVRDGLIVLRDGSQEQIVCPVGAVRLRGDHNLLNVLAAVVLADSAEIPVSAMQHAIATFTGIPHRLEPVGTRNGVQYINDSIATAPERALAALAAFHEPLVLLAGGRDKDLPWESWADHVLARVEHLILFGELAPAVHETVRRRRISAENRVTHTVQQVESVADAVALAHTLARPGMVVLLSPGGTSYDAYPDFAARGEHFRTLVQQLPDPESATPTESARK